MEVRAIKVGAIQMKTMPGSTKKAKLEHSLSLIEEASKEDVIVSAVLDLEEVEKARIAIPLLRELRHDLYAQSYSHLKYDEFNPE